ncbi:hypothetical protein ACFWN7_00470 [Agromyces sp. NPDC058484]|uniref:hypothetical protein n=1 Tax=Agromyces sp. NPDC058484 TaxID=3346524 RepID=UPI003662C49D
MLAAIPEVGAALKALAERIAGSPAASWWLRPRQAEQWAVEWQSARDPVPSAFSRPSEVLATWARCPGGRIACTAGSVAGCHGEFQRRVVVGAEPDSADDRVLPSGEPAGLVLVEDSFGETEATALPIRGTGRTLEIRAAEEWVALCREFPLDVTASRRHDWYRVTGRDGAWVMPDWERVAQAWDAVHLTVMGYLSAAARALEVESDMATVIAGWAPDTTL